VLTTPGIKAMVEGVYAHSQSSLNFPIVFTELEEGQPRDLGEKEGIFLRLCLCCAACCVQCTRVWVCVRLSRLARLH
jgi:hypothetical protein